MSARGVNFADRWMAEHLPSAMTDDLASVSDVVDKLMKAAAQEGVPAIEIDEEVDSIYEAIFDWMVHREGSLAG